MRDSIKELRGEVERLRRRMEQRPVLSTAKGSIIDRTIIIIGGNVITADPFDGIKYVTDVTSVPSAYDPNVDTSFIDGIGRGTLYIDNIAQTDKVLIVNDSRGGGGDTLIPSDRIYAGAAVQIDVDGGGTVTAYVVG